MATRSRLHPRVLALAVLLTVAGAMMVAASGPSSAAVTAVRGSAYGYSASISLFNGAPIDFPPTPVVTLPPGGSANPITDSAQEGLVELAPATIFSSGPITVSTQGTLGSGGGVTSQTVVNGVNRLGSEPLTASKVTSTCKATEATGPRGEVIIEGGMLRTDSGLDRNNDGDFDDPGEHGPVDVPVPNKPDPNTVVPGHIHLNATATDNFEYVFNEQIQNSDGSLTVNAVHERLLGPTAKGDVIIGQAVCGITATPDTSPPTSPPTSGGGTTTTTTTTTIPSGGGTTTTTTTTSVTTTTTTTTPPIPGGSALCSQLLALRARTNAQITAAEQGLPASLGDVGRAAAITRLEAARTQANTQIDTARARVGCA